MAKAKKSESAPNPAAKKAPAKKVAAKKSAAPTSQPMVDTTLAAQNAAKHLAAGLPRKAAASSGGSSPAKNESAMFKNLKQNISKPHLTGLDGILDKSSHTDSKRSNLPFGGGKQVGHNQTFGADVTRSGVPRRTPG
jgi:hypothetical protein